jgi:hypothetical protein
VEEVGEPAAHRPLLGAGCYAGGFHEPLLSIYRVALARALAS